MALRRKAASKVPREELPESENTQPLKKSLQRISPPTAAKKTTSKKSSTARSTPHLRSEPTPNSGTTKESPDSQNSTLASFSIEDLLIEAAHKKAAGRAIKEAACSGSATPLKNGLPTTNDAPQKVAAKGNEPSADPICLESFLRGTQRLELFPPASVPSLGASSVKSEAAAAPPQAPQKEDEAIEKMDTAIKSLSKLECEVMSALFPTDGSIPQSYELIASRFGMTVEEVKGISDNALRGLRGTRGPNGRTSTAWN